MFRRALTTLFIAFATVLLIAPHAYAGSWQSYSGIKEIDGGDKVASTWGDFYSSTTDDRVEFRGTLWVREGDCAYVEFYVNITLLTAEEWIKVAENRRHCNTSSQGARREYDTTRNDTPGSSKKVKLRICQEQWGPDDCESKTFWMAS